jgi:hypothetical protein
MRSHRFRSAALAAAAALAVVAVTPAEARVRQMIVFKSGKAVTKNVSTRGLRVRVRRKRCGVASRTPLAALFRSRPGRIGLRDFGSCSRDPRDATGLFVRSIRRDRNRGRRGWAYKVGRRAGTTGAADPSGPFGNGRRLRNGQRVLWFYCVLRGGGCQRTLSIRITEQAGGLTVKVVGYNDPGRGVLVEGATVHAGATTALTGADGRARLSLPSGSYRVYAEKRGLVRSFRERARVP